MRDLGLDTTENGGDERQKIPPVLRLELCFTSALRKKNKNT